MQIQAQPKSEIDRQAFRELARTRIDGLVRRVAFYVLAAAIGAAFVPVLWEALCLGLIAVAEFAEHRAARALLAADGPGASAAESRRANALAAAHIATASAVALALAVIWEFTGPAAKALPICLLAIAVLDAARAGHQVYGLMMLRQALIMGTAVAMTLRDVAFADGVTREALSAGFLPVVLLAAFVLLVSHARARETTATGSGATIGSPRPAPPPSATLPPRAASSPPSATSCAHRSMACSAELLSKVGDGGFQAARSISFSPSLNLTPSTISARR